VAILLCIVKLFKITVYDYIFFSAKSSIMSASYVLNCIENGVQVDAIYTDFSKAFDKTV
jgi:hypothetical protein